MSISELIPALKDLSPEDKRLVIDLLAQDLSGDPEYHVLPVSGYEIWSPEISDEGACLADELIAADRTQNG